jgi:hypothetical protein
MRETISAVEAVHQLRQLLDLDVREAISHLIDLLATGQLPPVRAVLDGIPTRIDQRWWWASVDFHYPNSAATLALIVDGKSRPTRITDIEIDFAAWKRVRVQGAASADADKLNKLLHPEPVPLQPALQTEPSLEPPAAAPLSLKDAVLKEYAKSPPVEGERPWGVFHTDVLKLCDQKKVKGRGYRLRTVQRLVADIKKAKV